ncbi:MAG: TRAP transporter substrate-binding protein DctP [Chloroflexi bacterium]|nr:TRAP transporter substrate-binding protein DctP [Chloroflexota bacterium]
MKKGLISVVLMLTLVLGVIAAACAAPKPTPTPLPTATPRPTPTVGPAATPAPTSVGPTATPAVAPTAAPTATPGPTAAAAPTPTAGPGAAPGKVYKWVYASPVAATAVPWFVQLLREIEEASGGILEIEYLAKGEHPYSDPDLIKAVRDGLVDMAYNTSGYISGTDPKPALMTLPFILAGATDDEIFWLWDKMYDDVWAPVLDKYNQEILALQWATDMVISATVPATSFEGVKGHPLRAVGKEQADLIAAVGFRPEVIAWGEVPAAIQRGIVDGVWVSVSSPYALGFYENLKYITLAPGASTLDVPQMVNRNALSELPESARDAIRGKFEEWRKMVTDARTQANSLAAWKAVAEYGVNVVRMPQAMMEDIQKRVRPVWDDWARRVGPEGPQLIDKLQSLRKEWAKTH